jgi:hypothetical protein
MERIAQAAKGLMDSMGSAPAEAETAPVQKGTPMPEAAAAPAAGTSGISEGDSRMLTSLGKLFTGKEDKSRSTALLMAMRPYMRPEKQEKLDRAMKIAQMVHIAGAVLQVYGGNSHGL